MGWRNFLKKWGIRHRLSSAMYPESNSRAEQGVRVGKRLIREHTGQGGSLLTDEISRGLLQYLNTPLRGLLESPAQIVFGRHIRDTLPRTPTQPGWTQKARYTKLGMAKLKAEQKEKLDEHSKNLAP